MQSLTVPTFSDKNTIAISEAIYLSLFSAGSTCFQKRNCFFFFSFFFAYFKFLLRYLPCNLVLEHPSNTGNDVISKQHAQEVRQKQEVNMEWINWLELILDNVTNFNMYSYRVHKYTLKKSYKRPLFKLIFCN